MPCKQCDCQLFHGMESQISLCGNCLKQKMEQGARAIVWGRICSATPAYIQRFRANITKALPLLHKVGAK